MAEHGADGAAPREGGRATGDLAPEAQDLFDKRVAHCQIRELVLRARGWEGDVSKFRLLRVLRFRIFQAPGEFHDISVLRV